MIFPSADEYLQIVEQKTPGTLPSLRDHRFVLEGAQPFSIRGNYAIIFKTTKEGKEFAIRCFTDSEEEIFERYRQAAAYCKDRPLPWKVNFDLLENQVRFHEYYFPVVKMDWLEGSSLKDHIGVITKNASAIDALQAALVALSQDLEKNSIAHGNLNLHHIRVQNSNGKPVLRLLDYDSIFIPAFYKKNCLSAGTPGFQHPMRLASDFSETIDRFSFWVLLTALEAIKTDPSLWTDSARLGYDKNENLLFTYRDLCAPESSPTLQLLRSLPGKIVQQYLDTLTGFCERRSLDDIDAPELLVAATKKSITDSKINQRVAVVEKAPTKVEQPGPAAAAAETVAADEILLFEADQDSIHEGEAVTLRWKVKGESRLHISGLGYVHEKSGMRKLVLKYPSDFVLTIGNRTKAVKVNVLPKAKDLFTSKDVFTADPKKRSAWKVAGFAAACLLVFVAVYFLSAGRDESKEPPRSAIVAPMQTPQEKTEPEIFSSEKLGAFLSRLYACYNQRSSSGILDNYAPKLIEYYDAANLEKDSLAPIIQDLFIRPAYYHCEADMSSMRFTQHEKDCLLTIRLNETIQANKQSGKQVFTSTTEYIVNPSYKIISERHID